MTVSKIVSVDPLNTNAGLLLKLFVEVMNFGWGPSELVIIFAMSLISKASKHSLHAHTCPSPLVENVFTIYFFNYTNLNECTMIIAKHKFMNKAKNLGKDLFELPPTKCNIKQNDTTLVAVVIFGQSWKNFWPRLYCWWDKGSKEL